MFIKNIIPADGFTAKVDTPQGPGHVPLVAWGAYTKTSELDDQIVGFVILNDDPHPVPVTELENYGVKFLGYGRIAAE